MYRQLIEYGCFTAMQDSLYSSLLSTAYRIILWLLPDLKCTGGDLDKRCNLVIPRCLCVSVYTRWCNVICLLRYLCSILSDTTFPLDRRCWHIKNQATSIWSSVYIVFLIKMRRFRRGFGACVWAHSWPEGEQEFHNDIISINVNIVQAWKLLPQNHLFTLLCHVVVHVNEVALYN